MASSDLKKEVLYESVKTLLECDAPHIHLFQQKLFTLYSLAFQYLLFMSTKEKGHYIIRIEDSFLADKLTKKSKDENTRKFMDKLIIPRRMRYGDSTFHLDYFNLSTWAGTNDLPKDKVKAALVVKNTSNNPVIEEGDFRHLEENLALENAEALPKNYYLTSLQSFCPKTIVIAFDHEFEGVERIGFPFIKDKDQETVSGVKISQEIDLSKFKD
jgi:hypothetical protein